MQVQEYAISASPEFFPQEVIGLEETLSRKIVLEYDHHIQLFLAEIDSLLGWQTSDRTFNLVNQGYRALDQISRKETQFRIDRCTCRRSRSTLA